ncbi:MAG: haloacid dehalogenase type II [Betaproteobacteria bacterium]|jgi:2-haloacid dehalogenase|nr:haloacid dehalogenase type II [Rhodocyclaceae bacterium]MCA3146891.1 haloacid dehalogenase type II [Rhodocyclaceae bacterium]MCE2899018.1 haloacid dehalogenase type II [Betaproteobacteria bacterium]
MNSPLKAFIFDAYGTLLDVHSVAGEAERHFPGQGAQLSALWRQKQLEYTWLRSLMGRYADFETVTRQALEHAAESLGLPLEAPVAAALMAAYRTLTAFADAHAALEALSPRPRIILSNGSPAMLEAAVRHAGLDHHLQATLSVDSLRSFKPTPAVYRLAVDHLGEPAAHIGFVSANYWDAAGAASFGLRVFWLNRTGRPPDRLGVEPATVLNGLHQLPQYAR